MADEILSDEIEVGSGRSSKLPMIIVGAVALLLGVGGGVGASIFLADGGDAEGEEEGEIVEGEDGVQAAPEAADEMEIAGLGNFIVNLRDSAGGRILQMEISVEGEPDATARITEREAQVRDAVLMLASDYSYLELEGVDGKMRLRDDILVRINSVVDPTRVSRVYFTSFVVQ